MITTISSNETRNNENLYTSLTTFDIIVIWRYLFQIRNKILEIILITIYLYFWESSFLKSCFDQTCLHVCTYIRCRFSKDPEIDTVRSLKKVISFSVD